MKKWFLLSVGAVVVLASCGNKNDNQARIQALIDSTVNANAAKHDAENATKNDSILKAMEKEKAEAMSREQQRQKSSEKINAKKTNDSSTSGGQSPH